MPRLISLIGHPGTGKRTVAKILAARHGFAVFDVNEPVRFALANVEHLKRLITREGNALPWVRCFDNFVKVSPPNIAILGISSPAEIREVVGRGSAIVHVAGGMNRNGCPYLLSEYAQSKVRLFGIYNRVAADAANIGYGNTMPTLVELVEKTVFDISQHLKY